MEEVQKNDLDIRGAFVLSASSRHSSLVPKDRPDDAHRLTFDQDAFEERFRMQLFFNILGRFVFGELHSSRAATP